MALMEAPSIIVGMLLISIFNKDRTESAIPSTVIKHSLTNESVLLILGSLFIGFMASEEQAQGIKPFTTDIFKGFLAVFLLDMGITSGRKLKDFLDKGRFALFFAIIIPMINGCLVAFLTSFFIESAGDRFLFSILAASASYIAVPAAMRIAAPTANPSLYLPMALAITFPFNITLGMPLYLFITQCC
ncbi:MAG: sodium-dependent bicarbonate transport family permease, partial [Bacteroidota bacterium]